MKKEQETKSKEISSHYFSNSTSDFGQQLGDDGARKGYDTVATWPLLSRLPEGHRTT
jgi:hypothetical protein